MLWFVILLLLTGCSKENPSSPAVFTGVAMTIPYKVQIGEALTRSQRNEVEKIIATLFSDVNETFNRFNPDSELSRINRLPSGKKQRLSEPLWDLLQRTDQMVVLTEGRFDPTVLALYLYWEKKLTGKTPIEDLEEVQGATGWHLVHLDDHFFWKENSDTQIDLGGIAKGHAIDLLAERLRARGYENFFIDWGGEIFASGKHPENRDWMIAILHPAMQEEIDILPLKGEAVATSGDYLQYWKDSEGRLFFHIVNPQTGTLMEATSGSITSATVVAPTCLEADALATASMLFTDMDQAKAWATRVQEHSPEITLYWLQRDFQSSSSESSLVPTKL